MSEAPTVFYNENHPGMMHKKSIEQLEYENRVLICQLQERDEVIAMFKSKIPLDNLPINDEVIKQLNLELSHKNMLVQQIQRSLEHFEESFKTQCIEITPICSEQFVKIRTIMSNYEAYPIIITQRLVETSREAEKIYIKDSSHRSELHILKEKIEKYEYMYTETTRELERYKVMYSEKTTEFERYQSMYLEIKERF